MPLQPQLVSKLIVEDVAPDVSRSAETSIFPAYLGAMKAVPLDLVTTLGEARQLGNQELKDLIQVVV